MIYIKIKFQWLGSTKTIDEYALVQSEKGRIHIKRMR
jgi:hypothetical protein